MLATRMGPIRPFSGVHRRAPTPAPDARMEPSGLYLCSPPYVRGNAWPIPGQCLSPSLSDSAAPRYQTATQASGLGLLSQVVATATPSEMKPRFCSGLIKGNFVSVLIRFGVITAIYPLLSELTHFNWWIINGFVFCEHAIWRWQGRNQTWF